MKYKACSQIQNLGDDFYDFVKGAIYPKHVLRFRNNVWAAHVGLDELSVQAWEDHFARFKPLPDNIEKPLAMRYHGHQFDCYNPNLGDGRGFIFAQLRDLNDDRLLDLGTKGSGQTPYSRGGDGRLTLKGGVREVLATEMLEGLGVYTSKTFSLIETGEDLIRPDEPSPTRSSIMFRLSHSHIRVGTFQYHFYKGNKEHIETLIQFSIEHYFPYLKEFENKRLVFFREVSERSAALVASWMVSGFVHGVLNSDNMIVTGESFDYGPYRFLPILDPHFTAAYFDQTGLYAYGNQPTAVKKNVVRLAECLYQEPFPDEVMAVLDNFNNVYSHALCEKFLKRLGVESINNQEDLVFMDMAFEFLEQSKVDYASFYFDWFGGMISEQRAMQGKRKDFYQGKAFEGLKGYFKKYKEASFVHLEHVYFSQDEPCSLLIDEIEEIWDAIEAEDDWKPFNEKIASIQEMGQVLSLGTFFKK